MGSSESNRSRERIWTRFAIYKATRWISGFTRNPLDRADDEEEEEEEGEESI
jgi:hypothetical protein